MSTAATWGIPPSPSSYANWVQECRIAKNVFLTEEAEIKLKEKEETHQARLECRAKEKGKPYIPKPEKQKATTPVEKDSPEVVVPVIGKTVIETKRKLLVITRQEKEKAEQLKQQQAAEKAASKERLESKPEKRILNLKLKPQGGTK